VADHPDYLDVFSDLILIGARLVEWFMFEIGQQTGAERELCPGCDLAAICAAVFFLREVTSFQVASRHRDSP